MPTLTQRKKGNSRVHISRVAPSKQRGIQAFAKVTKAQVDEGGKSTLKRRYSAEESDVENQRPDDQGFKRSKAAPEKPRLHVQVVVPKKVEQPSESGSRKRKAWEEPSTPPPPERNHAAVDDRKRKKTVARAQKLTETPTKGARSLLEKFAFASSSSPAKKPSPPLPKHDTPPSSPACLAEDVPLHLPEELQDLINLHSSFLTALSLYYAHNGLSNPADLRNLYPGIERTWKKRSVTIDDIRRILAIIQHPNSANQPNLFHLTDYGNSKICIEVSETANPHRPINEPLFNKTFTKALTEKWLTFTSLPTIGRPSPPAFLSHLPLHPLPPSHSPTTLGPLISRGQSRLSDLKASALAAQSRINTPNPSHPPPNQPGAAAAPPSTKARASLLLDRLSAKSAVQSTLPTPPTPAQASRHRALQRLPEIAPVLQSLAVSRQKHDSSDATTASPTATETTAQQHRQPATNKQVSFSMTSLVADLQMSLRNPIARAEAVECVRCLAEVAPEWVGVWEVGGVVGVVVKGGGVGRGGWWRRGLGCWVGGGDCGVGGEGVGG